MYLVADYDGKIIASNGFFKEYTSHINPARIYDLLCDTVDEDAFVTAVTAAKESSPDPQRMWIKIKQKSGALRWNNFNVFSFPNSIQLIGTVVYDISSPITVAQYDELNTRLDELSHLANHDIYQPLTSVMGLVDILMAKDGEGESENAEIHKMIQVSLTKVSDAMLKIIKKASRRI